MNATIGCDSNGSWTYLGNNNDNDTIDFDFFNFIKAALT